MSNMSYKKALMTRQRKTLTTTQTVSKLKEQLPSAILRLPGTPSLLVEPVCFNPYKTKRESNKCGSHTDVQPTLSRLTHQARAPTVVDLIQYRAASGKVAPGWLMCSLPGSRTIRADKGTSRVIHGRFIISLPKVPSWALLRTQKKCWTKAPQTVSHMKIYTATHLELYNM